MVTTKSIEERFFERVDKTTDCWNWSGAFSKSNGGMYGSFSPKHHVSIAAHRWSFEYFHKKKISEGMVIDHLCNNPKCVNPAHLRETTQRENILRGNNRAANYAKRTHCDNGHEYTPENTRITKAGARKCRICRREESRQEKLRRKLKNGSAVFAPEKK